MNSKPVLILIMTWHLIGNRPLLELIMAKFSDTCITLHADRLALFGARTSVDTMMTESRIYSGLEGLLLYHFILSAALSSYVEKCHLSISLLLMHIYVILLKRHMDVESLNMLN